MSAQCKKNRWIKKLVILEGKIQSGNKLCCFDVNGERKKCQDLLYQQL